MSGLEVEITCSFCGDTHRIPLDPSGHYGGPLPCQPGQRIELQIDPAQWREMVEREAAKRQH